MPACYYCGGHSKFLFTCPASITNANTSQDAERRLHVICDDCIDEDEVDDTNMRLLEQCAKCKHKSQRAIKSSNNNWFYHQSLTPEELEAEQFKISCIVSECNECTGLRVWERFLVEVHPEISGYDIRRHAQHVWCLIRNEDKDEYETPNGTEGEERSENRPDGSEDLLLTPKQDTSQRRSLLHEKKQPKQDTGTPEASNFPQRAVNPPGARYQSSSADLKSSDASYMEEEDDEAQEPPARTKSRPWAMKRPWRQSQMERQRRKRAFSPTQEESSSSSKQQDKVGPPQKRRHVSSQDVDEAVRSDPHSSPRTDESVSREANDAQPPPAPSQNQAPAAAAAILTVKHDQYTKLARLLIPKDSSFQMIASIMFESILKQIKILKSDAQASQTCSIIPDAQKPYLILHCVINSKLALVAIDRKFGSSIMLSTFPLDEIDKAEISSVSKRVHARFAAAGSADLQFEFIDHAYSEIDQLDRSVAMAFLLKQTYMFFSTPWDRPISAAMFSEYCRLGGDSDYSKQHLEAVVLNDLRQL